MRGRSPNGTWLERALLAVLAVGVLVVAGSARAAEPPPEPPRPLVVVSINVLHGGVWSGLLGDGQDLERRLELIAKGLRALQPDVVGVQEASTSRGRGNVAERLAAALGFAHVYAPAAFGLTGWRAADRVIGAIMNFTEGPAILSRFPITASDVRTLPRCRGFFDVRVALRADVATPWGALPVYSTHLSWGACEAEEIARFVAERRSTLPAIVMGDFNATEDTASIAFLTGSAGFVDVFRTVNPSAPGLTVWQDPTAAERTVRKRVDYVFLVGGTGSAGRPRASSVVLDQPWRAPDGRTVWPSDHYGVLAEIDLGQDL